MTIMLGGSSDPTISSLSADDLVKKGRQVIKQTLGIETHPDASLVHIAKQCIPQYPVGYNDNLRILVNKTEKHLPHFTLAGTGIHGVSLNNCINYGKRIAEQYVSSIP